MDTYYALDRALASTAEIVTRLRSDQLTLGTPCADWHVQALLNHMLGTLWLSEAAFADQAPRHLVVPGGVPSADLVGSDPVAAYTEAAAAALAAARLEGTLTRTHQTPLGARPGAALAGLVTLDLFVHGWDLAQATRQSTTLDADLAAHVFAFAQQALTDDIRGSFIGPAISVASDAPVVAQLVAFLGRRP